MTGILFMGFGFRIFSIPFPAVGGWAILVAVIAFLLLALGLLLRGMRGRVFLMKRDLPRFKRPLPARITLQKVDSVSWLDPQKSQTLAQGAMELGFQPISQFFFTELGVGLYALYHPRENAYSAIYNHPKAGVWADIFCRYQDGGNLTVTNSPNSGVLDQPPGKIVLSLSGASFSDLFTRFLMDRRRVPQISATAEQFVERFQNAYAEEMDWRNQRGGPTEEEIRRVAQRKGMAVSEQQVKLVRELEAEKARQAGEGKSGP